MAKSFNRIIYPYSKISRLPKYLQHVALLIRYLISRAPKYTFEADCMATSIILDLNKRPVFNLLKRNRLRQADLIMESP